MSEHGVFIELTAYSGCLTDEPEAYQIIVNLGQVVAIQDFVPGWTEVALSSNQRLHLKGNQSEVLGALHRIVEAL